MDLKDTKTHRVAKAIYKRYIENHSVVAKQLKPATKTYIRDSVKRQQIDSAMFDQAQTEIQSTMEENAYQMFLTSDIYLEYVRTGGENQAHGHPNGLGSLKVVCGYLPTLNEEEEWSCQDFKAKALASVVGLSAKALRATAPLRTAETLENGYRSYRRVDPVNPYHVNSGYVFAPATSANDSEISSDAMTDDSMSMTDSSVDGIPPYKTGSKKHLQREMHRSVKMNGQVSLPHFPRTHRLPKEMTPVEPATFAAELIARLEKLRREQETMSSLEERLQQIKEEEERDDGEVSSGSGQLASVTSTAHHQTHPLGLLPAGSCEEDPQAILDEHLSRVLKTPGCQSPGVVRHSPRSRSPDRHHHSLHHASGTKLQPPILGSPSLPYPLNCGSAGAGKAFLAKQATKHIHHHYIHHHAGPKTKEQIEVEAAQRVKCQCPGSADYCAYPKCRSHGKEQGAGPTEPFTFGSRSSTLSKRVCKAGDGGAPLNGEVGGQATTPLQLPTDGTDRSQNVWQWILESERQSKHKAHSFIISPALINIPNFIFPLRHSTSSLQRDRSHPVSFLNGNTPLSTPALQTEDEKNTATRDEKIFTPTNRRAHAIQRIRARAVNITSIKVFFLFFFYIYIFSQFKEPKKHAGAHGALGTELVVTYFFCGEEIPYRRMMKTHSLTLGHFKEQLRKKGNYRYYFKKASDEFECGAVFEEIWDEGTVLPMYEGKILGKVERVD
ncbi:AXIN2 protein, partial [Amia calva]|nr:AXIN2 protein [Amia calva]